MLHANHISPHLVELCVKVGLLCAGLLSFVDGCVSICFLLYSRHDGIVHRKNGFSPLCMRICVHNATTFSAAVIAIVADKGPQVSVDS